MTEIKREVQRQFGANAPNFVTSSVHATGRSLQRIIEMVRPEESWRVLDVATGGGHNALAYSGHVELVVATDITGPMLHAASEFISSKKVPNVIYCRTDAERLSFKSESFDCVTSRIAPHHFPDVNAFLTEAARLTRPHGVIAISDNIGSEKRRVTEYVNSMEKLRDPSHHWAYSISEWIEFYRLADLHEIEHEIFEKVLDFASWTARLNVTGKRLEQLEALIRRAPANAIDWLKPVDADGRLTFHIQEAIIVGRKP